MFFDPFREDADAPSEGSSSSHQNDPPADELNAWSGWDSGPGPADVLDAFELYDEVDGPEPEYGDFWAEVDEGGR